MSGNLSRRRGHQLERECAQLFRDNGFPYARTKREARGGDFSVTDNGVDLVETGNLRVQCKRGRRPCSVSKIEEIKDTTGIPLLLTKGDRGPLYAILKMEDLILLFSHTHSESPEEQGL